MNAPRIRLLLVAVLAAVAATAIGSAVAPALDVRAAPKKVTPSGVGSVTLGKTYTSLRNAGLLGRLRPGCELAGPATRSASLRPPLKGSVDLTNSAPRKVAAILITGGATARGVGIGASIARIRQAFPRATIDRGAESVFGITILTVPKSGGGRLQFAVDVKTKKTVTIAIPALAFCD